MPYESITGLLYDSGSTAEALEKILDVADHEGLRRRQTEARAQGRLLGIGFAHYTERNRAIWSLSRALPGVKPPRYFE